MGMYDLTEKQIADIISASVLSVTKGPEVFIPKPGQEYSEFVDELLVILNGDQDLASKIANHVCAIGIGMRIYQNVSQAVR